MAKKSKIVKNQRRAATVARYASRRTALKDIIRSPSSAPEQRSTAQRALARQPRDASPVRLRNRDAIDGRPRGHLRKFGLSRVRVRQLAFRTPARCPEGQLVDGRQIRAKGPDEGEEKPAR